MRIRLRRDGVPVALLLGVALANCEGAPATDSGPVTTRNSAGIQIIHSESPAWPQGAAWALADEPLLTLGDDGARPEEQFTRIVTALRSADGRIVVANANHPPEIRIYSSSGSLLASLGGAGEGPGEFRFIGKVYLSADTVIAWEPSGRFSFFDLDGAFLGAVRPTAAFRPSGSLAVVWGRFGDGTYLVGPNSVVPNPDGRGIVRGTIHFRRGHPTEGLTDTVASLPGYEFYVPSDDRSTWAPVPLGRRTTVLAHGRAVYAGTGDSFEIRVFDLNGDLKRVIRRAFQRRVVEPEHVRDWIQARTDMASAEQAEARVRGLLEDVPAAKTMPAHGDGLLVDEARNLWVEEYAAPGEGRRSWSAFSPSGRWLGSVEIPRRLRLTHVGEREVLGVWTDDLDVPSVRVYELVKSAPESP